MSEFEEAEAAAAVGRAPGRALPRALGQFGRPVNSFTLRCSFQLASLLQQSQMFCVLTPVLGFPHTCFRGKTIFSII